MKFIRDIIAEKTNMVDANGRQAPEGEMAALTNGEESAILPGDIDPVHMVASGATSLGRAGHISYRTENDQDASSDMEDNPQPTHSTEPLDGDPETDDEEGFDLLSDPDEDDMPDPLQEDQEPADLFADIWTDDPAPEDETEEDFLAAEASQPDTEEALDVAPLPRTNAAALMQSTYPKSPAFADDPMTATTPDPDPQDALSSQQEHQADPATDTPDTSAFHKILRRQESLPSENQPATAPADEATQPTTAPVQVPAPAAGRARRQAGRVKTRLLGFGNDFGGEKDLFAADGDPVQAAQVKFPVGWMVIVSGPGRGTSFTMFNGVSQIGRGEDQAVRLDFGDTSISRSNHAAVAYDPEQQGFFLGHGGKANLVRLNGSPVLSTEPLKNGALIRIGETTLRFVGLCGDDFDWGDTQDGEGDNVRFD